MVIIREMKKGFLIPISVEAYSDNEIHKIDIDMYKNAGFLHILTSVVEYKYQFEVERLESVATVVGYYLTQVGRGNRSELTINIYDDDIEKIAARTEMISIENKG